MRNFIKRVAFEHGIKYAEKYLSQCLSDISEVAFIDDIPDLYNDVLKEMIVIIMNENPDFGNEIITLVENLSFNLATRTISIVAENNYERTRNTLQQLGREVSCLKLKTFILDLIRDYDRSGGTRDFIELLEIVTVD